MLGLHWQDRGTYCYRPLIKWIFFTIETFKGAAGHHILVIFTKQWIFFLNFNTLEKCEWTEKTELKKIWALCKQMLNLFENFTGARRLPSVYVPWGNNLESFEISDTVYWTGFIPQGWNETQDYNSNFLFACITYQPDRTPLGHWLATLLSAHLQKTQNKESPL